MILLRAGQWNSGEIPAASACALVIGSDEVASSGWRLPVGVLSVAVGFLASALASACGLAGCSALAVFSGFSALAGFSGLADFSALSAFAAFASASLSFLRLCSDASASLSALSFFALASFSAFADLDSASAPCAFDSAEAALAPSAL